MTLRIGSLQTRTTVNIVMSSGLHIDQRVINWINYNSASTDLNPKRFCRQKVARNIQAILVEF